MWRDTWNSVLLKEWVIVVFKANSAIFQLYHGENKLIINEMMMKSTLYQTNMLSLVLYSASSLKQQSAGRHVAPLGHIILIPSQPVFALSP
jgi:hypothetical protein